jgi:hypothetical protein
MKDDYTDECLRTLPPELSSHGVEALRSSFCQVCVNTYCGSSKGYSTKWDDRMHRQLEALLHPFFADIKDPMYSEIHHSAFITLDQDPDDWTVKGHSILITDSEENRASSKAFLNAQLLKGMYSDSPARVDAPTPPPAQAPAQAPAPMPERVQAPAPASEPTPVQAPAREGQLVPKSLSGTRLNTEVPSGGLYVGGPIREDAKPVRKEIIITDPEDPWAPKDAGSTNKGTGRVRKVVRASDGQVVKK